MAKIENEFVKNFKIRRKKCAIETLKLCDEMPFKKKSTRIISNKLGRSAISIAANYRAVSVARSDKEFVSKLSITAKEGDESCFWLEVLDEGEFYPDKERIRKLHDEADQITRIISKSRQTMRQRLNKQNIKPKIT
ncbi:four helix bundle protein [Bacteroidia bacterium]|nr:four helix bundle protein [Bacteroidia bacterium]MDC1395093.1 four helix bundle protein [Bacteroidia bacterium]